ncbi:hypothetical protein B6D60_04240 [candidate division KSB1 bacterium 4484_87]|nr:MAG: hypothetical protein B6D60_04240 [candidate division KSB1 bacterium 4484_87]
MSRGATARHILWISMAAILIGACASGIKLQFTRPGQIAFAGIKRLVVAPVTGIRQAPRFEEELVAALGKTGFYTILRDADVRNILLKHGVTYDDIAAADSLRMSDVAVWLQADGILFCELKDLDISYMALGAEKVERLVWTGEYERDEFGEIVMVQDSSGAMIKKKKLKIKFIDQKFQLRDAKVEVAFRLIDFQIGRIIGTWNKEEHYIENIVEGDKFQEFRSEKEIKQMLMDKVIREFVQEIGPRIEFVKRQPEGGIAELDSGIVFAQQNNWEKALDVWSRAEDKYPNNASVYFDVGLAHEAVGNYKMAEMYYLKAGLLAPKQKKYRKAVSRIRKIWDDKATMQ